MAAAAAAAPLFCNYKRDDELLARIFNDNNNNNNKCSVMAVSRNLYQNHSGVKVRRGQHHVGHLVLAGAAARVLPAPVFVRSQRVVGRRCGPDVTAVERPLQVPYDALANTSTRRRRSFPLQPANNNNNNNGIHQNLQFKSFRQQPKPKRYETRSAHQQEILPVGVPGSRRSRSGRHPVSGIGFFVGG